jgi:hypothetical protein
MTWCVSAIGLIAAPKLEEKRVNAHALTLSDIGSSTWARTRDLRINSRMAEYAASPRQCFVSG